MNSILDWLSRFFDSWKFWIVVPAWDVAVRVRLGKTASALPPGLHFRIPFVDEITLVNTRQRVWTTASVDVPLADGRILTQQATFGYRIVDPLLCVMTYTMPDASIAAYIQAALVLRRSERAILSDVGDEIDGTGLSLDFVLITQNASCRAIRLLNNNWGLMSGDGSRAPAGIARV